MSPHVFVHLVSFVFLFSKKKNVEFSWIWTWNWIAAADGGGCHGDCVSDAAGCQVCDDVILISTGVANLIDSLLIF